MENNLKTETVIVKMSTHDKHKLAELSKGESMSVVIRSLIREAYEKVKSNETA